MSNLDAILEQVKTDLQDPWIQQPRIVKVLKGLVLVLEQIIIELRKR